MEEKLITLNPQGYIRTWNTDILRALNEMGIVFHKLDSLKEVSECGPKYLLYSIDGEPKKPKAKKCYKGCTHLYVDGMVIDKDVDDEGKVNFKTCEHCKYRRKPLGELPCVDCLGYSEWECHPDFVIEKEETSELTGN